MSHPQYHIKREKPLSDLRDRDRFLSGSIPPESLSLFRDTDTYVKGASTETYINFHTLLSTITIHLTVSRSQPYTFLDTFHISSNSSSNNLPQQAIVIISRYFWHLFTFPGHTFPGHTTLLPGSTFLVNLPAWVNSLPDLSRTL